MHFQALGTLRVVNDGETVDLGPRKQQSLLALLLVHANEVVSTERILEHLWGDDTDGKENALWVYISRLRTALEPDRVERGESTVLLREAPGYVLVVDPASFDVREFERLSEAGRREVASDPNAASTNLALGLDLWRGPAFAGFESELLIQAEATRLNELRADVIEDRVDADLARGLAGELVAELETQRQTHPLRERPVSQLMLALYRSGRPAEALRAYGRFRRTVGDELGIEPSPDLGRLEQQILLHDERLQSGQTTSDPDVAVRTSAPNPFKGLLPFLEADAENFFGRDALVAEMVRSIAGGKRLLAVVGASGSGKSSAVRAGLVPALAKGAVLGSEDWALAYMVPGGHPFAEAEAALLRSSINAPASLDEQLRSGDDGLLRAALRVLPNADSHLVLVIDQFEEIFTLVEDDAIRRRFLTNLVTLLDEPHGRVSVVLTLRADFYGAPLTHPEFGARMNGSVINVSPLTSEELAAAALGPAQHAGVELEPSLLGELTFDVGAQPGALPLFQYALTELFEGRSGNTMSAASYRAMGGLSGALGRRASDLYEELDSEEKKAARQLFLRLVVIHDSEAPSRRRVDGEEIISLGIDTVVMQRVISLFGEHRLLSFDADRLTGAPTVEVAHEAILTAWPVLDEWLQASADDLRRHASLAVALREWELADRDADYLLSPARLGSYAEWSESSTMSLTAVERNYLEASDDKHREQAAKLAQQQLDDDRSRRRLWGLVAALIASLGVASLLLLGVFAGDDGPGPDVAFFGVRGFGTWNDNLATGLELAAQDMSFQLTDVSALVDPEAQFRELAETGPDIIISDSLPTFVAPDVFADFPDIRFGVVDAEVTTPNTTWVDFANHEGSFLVGVAAALQSETGTVGFIGATQQPVIEEFRAGFEAGAAAVNPDIRVLSAVLTSDYIAASSLVWAFAAPHLAYESATALYAEGADVVFAAAGFSGDGVFDAAVDYSTESGRHVWSVGVDNDQWFNVSEAERDHLLTSMIKRGDIGAYLLVEYLMNSEAGAPPLTLGLAEDGITLATSGDKMSATMLDRIEDFRTDIVEGRITVPTRPTGELFQTEGELLLAAAYAELTSQEIVEYTDWVVATYPADFESDCDIEDPKLDCPQLFARHVDEWVERS